LKNVLFVVFGVVVVGIGGLAALVAMQPGQLHVERNLSVAATPADVYLYANDFDKFQQWNPWREMDPEQVETYSENKVGPGAWYTWEGNEQVGKGRMSIREVVPDQKVVSDLQFLEPIANEAVVTLSFAPEGDGTKVTWALDQELDFGSKAFGLMVDMDTMLGGDFDRGLGKLRPLVETAAKERVAAAEAAAAVPADGAVPTDGAAAPAM